jgi:hypothetical protein
MAKIYALVADLFFSERIANGLAGLGHEAVVADLSEAALSGASPVELPAGAALAVIDLEAGEAAFAAIAAARSRQVPTLCFGPHEDLALRERALTAGATRVVAKSRLVSDFAGLVGRYAGSR